MTLQELQQVYDAYEQNEQMTGIRDQVYEELGGLHNSFENAAKGHEAPLSEEIREWLGTLNTLAAQPPGMSADDVSNALQRMEGFGDFLKKPVGDSTVYQEMREALIRQNPENAYQVIEDFERQLKVANNHFDLGLSEDYIQHPEREVVPEEPDIFEPDGDISPFTYNQMVADIMEGFQEDLVPPADKSHTLAQLIAFRSHTTNFEEGDELASISTIQRDVENIENSEVFRQAVAELDDEGYKNAAKDPDKFIRMLEERQAVIDRGGELQEENSEEEEEPEEAPVEEETEYPMRYRVLQKSIARLDTSDMTLEEKRSNLAVVFAANLIVRQGKGEELVNLDDFFNFAGEIKKQEAFQVLTKDMDDQEVEKAKNNPARYIRQMGVINLELDRPVKDLEEQEIPLENTVPKAPPFPEGYVPPVPGNVPGPVPVMPVKDNAGQEEPKAEEGPKAAGGQQEVIDENEEPEFEYEIIDKFEDGAVHTAEDWLNKVKKEASDKQKKGELNDRTAADLAIRVLAVRMLANAKRHESGSLGKELSEKEITDAEAKLRENGHCRQFCSNLTADGNQHRALKADVKKALQRGHCGGVEDEFKAYLQNLPGGGLDNSDANLSFYMPTGKERIEALQKQISAGKNPVLPTAEIVVLRNILKAERKKEATIDKPIPTTGSLRSDVMKLHDDHFFADAANNKSVKDSATAGHGGGIVEKVYGLKVKLDKEYQKQLKAGRGNLLSADKSLRALSEEGNTVLGANTRGGRMKALQKEAREINRQLEEASAEELPRVYERAKPIMAEYLIHNEDLYDKYGVPKGDNEKNLRKPMPWSTVETKVQKALELPKFRDMQLSVKNVRSAMNTIINAEFEPKPVENSMSPSQPGISSNPDAPEL